MTKLVEIIIIILLIWVTFNLLRLILKRLTLIRKLSSLKKTTGAVISYLENPFLSLFRISDTAELSVTIGSTVYVVRLYNGGGIGNVVHFASERFTVRFARMRTASYARSRGKQKMISARRGFAVGSKVIYFPPLSEAEVKSFSSFKTVPVLIFNPAPGEVSFVTPEKTSIKVAFTGDEVWGTRIFTASTFVSYAEREYRNEQLKKKNEFYEPEYSFNSGF